MLSPALPSKVCANTSVCAESGGVGARAGPGDNPLNGERVQDGHTSDMVLTGTPEGVGMAGDPPRWLKPGDQVVIPIEGIGTLRNLVVAEKRLKSWFKIYCCFLQMPSSVA